MGDKAPKEFMQEVRWTGAFIGDGKMRVAYKRFHELKVQYLPKSGMTFEVVSKVTPVNAAEVGFDAKMDWFMRDRNQFYRMFYEMNCLHCLSSFHVDSKLRMNKAKLYKFDFEINSVKDDGSKTKEVYITTKDKYYAKFSQHFLEEMAATFDLRHTRFNDFEVEGEWNKGKFFKVTTNREWFKNFKIENMDGYMRKVEFNGKELMKSGFEKAGKKIKQTVELTDGTKVDTVLTWESDNYYKNKAKFSVKRDEGNFMDNEFEWDVQPNLSNMNVKDKTNIPSSPFPENFETEFEAIFKNVNDFNLGAYTYMAGEKMGIKFDAKNGMQWFF